ncbi:MAG: phosphate ABC transporter substrate-binding protein, partial [Myxococcota bacterium]
MRWLFVTLALIATPALAGPLTIKGSDTLVGLVQRWSSVVMKEEPSLKLQVTGGGSGTGLAALENGSTDIAMSSRPISAAERERLTRRYGAPPREVAVARDGVAFFVNAENPVRAVTLDELRALFLGDLTTWKPLAGVDRVVVVYTRENSSGTYDFVRERLLRGEEFPPRSQPLPGTGAVVNAVSRERWGIGFGGAAFARRVKTLAIADQGKEIHLTPDTVRQGAWPFARPLFFYL